MGKGFRGNEVDGHVAGRVTLKDIANATGFHVSTVSRALDPKSQVNLTDSAVQQIREAAAAMGYRRNRIAAGLRTKRTMTVGVVIPDITNALFPPIVRGIESVLEPEGYAAIIVSTDNLVERERHLVNLLAERGVDGILHAATLRDDRSIPALRAEGVPVVTLNRRTDDGVVASVVNDDRAGIRMTLEHLVEAGHRRIAHIAGPSDLSTGFERARSFREGCTALGLEPTACPVVVADRFDDASGHACATELLRMGPRVTAFLCANDRLALGAIAELADHGLECPRDMSVTGYNDMPVPEIMRPRLTTVRIRQAQAGQSAARLLLAAISGEEVDEDERHLTLPVELVPRESVAAPATAPRASRQGLAGGVAAPARRPRTTAARRPLPDR